MPIRRVKDINGEWILDRVQLAKGETTLNPKYRTRKVKDEYSIKSHYNNISISDEGEVKFE